MLLRLGNFCTCSGYCEIEEISGYLFAGLSVWMCVAGIPVGAFSSEVHCAVNKHVCARTCCRVLWGCLQTSVP